MIMADDNKLRERPTLKEKYTTAALREYAFWRKDQEMAGLKQLLERELQSDTAVDTQEDYRNPLSIEIRTELVIQLSWGGDGDGYKLLFAQTGGLISGLYFWENWFGVYEEVTLYRVELDNVCAAYRTDIMLEV